LPKNILLAATLPASPDRLFDMYLDPRLHAAVTGAPVLIGSEPGAVFAAFDGRIAGTVLHVERKRLIVQTWRAAHWPKEAIDSVLVLSFWPDAAGTRIELVQANVHADDFGGVSQGWEKYYWTPWRAYLERESAPKADSPG